MAVIWVTGLFFGGAPGDTLTGAEVRDPAAHGHLFIVGSEDVAVIGSNADDVVIVFGDRCPGFDPANRFSVVDDGLDLGGYGARFATRAEVLAAMEDTGDGAVLSFAPRATVTFAGITLADFAAADGQAGRLSDPPRAGHGRARHGAGRGDCPRVTRAEDAP